MTCIADHVRIPRDHHLMPHRFKGFGDTAKIAHAVVDNCDHGTFLEDVETFTLLTRPTQTHRTEPVPMHRGLIEILNVSPIRPQLRLPCDLLETKRNTLVRSRNPTAATIPQLATSCHYHLPHLPGGPDADNSTDLRAGRPQKSYCGRILKRDTEPVPTAGGVRKPGPG